MFRDKVGNSFGKFTFIETSLGLSHPDCDLGGVFTFSLADGQEQPQHVVSKARQETRDHSQVNQGYQIVFGKEDIARVRIGMNKAVEQYLFQICAEEFPSESGTINLHQSQ